MGLGTVTFLPGIVLMRRKEQLQNRVPKKEGDKMPGVQQRQMPDAGNTRRAKLRLSGLRIYDGADYARRRYLGPKINFAVSTPCACTGHYFVPIVRIFLRGKISENISDTTHCRSTDTPILPPSDAICTPEHKPERVPRIPDLQDIP